MEKMEKNRKKNGLNFGSRNFGLKTTIPQAIFLSLMILKFGTLAAHDKLIYTILEYFSFFGKTGY